MLCVMRKRMLEIEGELQKKYYIDVFAKKGQAIYRLKVSNNTIDHDRDINRILKLSSIQASMLLNISYKFQTHIFLDGLNIRLHDNYQREPYITNFNMFMNYPSVKVLIGELQINNQAITNILHLKNETRLKQYELIYSRYECMKVHFEQFYDRLLIMLNTDMYFLKIKANIYSCYELPNIIITHPLDILFQVYEALTKHPHLEFRGDDIYNACIFRTFAYLNGYNSMSVEFIIIFCILFYNDIYC